MKIPKSVLLLWAACVVLGAVSQTWCAYSMFNHLKAMKHDVRN